MQTTMGELRMDEIRLGAVELKFAGIVRANAPIPSGDHIRLTR